MCFFICLVGCDLLDEINAIDSMEDKNKVWVFTQFNVPDESDVIDSYYYYAQISKKLYDSVSHNEITSGFVLLKNVKYWGKNDLIYDYKNIENSGEMIFRIEHIVKMERINIEPIAGKGAEQFDDPEEKQIDGEMDMQDEASIETSSAT